MKSKQTTKSSSWIDIQVNRPPFGKEVLICCTDANEDYNKGITIGYLDQEIKTYNTTTKTVETEWLFEMQGLIGPCSFWQSLPELPSTDKKIK